MPSYSLTLWTTDRAAVLDQLEAAHRSVGGVGPGRRTATLHINHASAVLLSSQFQGFCRDLHDEGVGALVGAVFPAAFRPTLRTLLATGRKLDTGNPNPGNIGADFRRFGLDFWHEVYARDTRNEDRREHLEELNQWRNAIAHEAFDSAVLGSVSLRLEQVRAWRQACHQLALTFDAVLYNFLQNLTATPPW